MSSFSPFSSEPSISPKTGWARPTTNDLEKWPLPASFDQFLPNNVHNPISMTISLNSGLPLANIDALYHKIKITKKDEKHIIKFADTSVNMDRDFLLKWQPVQSEAPQAALFSEEIEGDYYSLVMLIPPQKHKEKNKLARDMVFIVDTSGSMDGASIRQAKSSLNHALSRLSPQDRFTIIAFNSHHKTLFSQLEYATPSNIQHASNWVNTLRSGGGTNMLPALQTSFKLHKDSLSLQQTIFITDGAVGNEHELFKEIHQNLGNTRLFTVGIGSAPNSYFMKKSAEFGRGTFTYIGNPNEISEQINTLFNKLEGATTKNVTLNWSNQAQIFPSNIPDLYLSEPLLISARSTDLQGSITIEGDTAHMPWQQHLNLNEHKESRGVSTLWARAKIEDLEDLKITGGDKDLIKQEIIDVALRHKLLSAYTSFVAVEKKIARPIEATLKSNPLQNAIPTGHTLANTSVKIPLPTTATTAEISWWIGLFCLFTLIIYRRMSGDS